MPGGVALVGGAALAISGAGGGLAIVLPVMLAAAAVSGALARRRHAQGAGGAAGCAPSSGREALSGRAGVVRNWANGSGQVFVDGALWRARRSWADEEEELGEGDSVVVERVSGLTLAVRRAEDWEEPC